MVTVLIVVGVESAPVSNRATTLSSRIRDREQTLAFAVRSIYPVWEVVAVRVAPPFQRQAFLLEHLGHNGS